MFGWEEKEIGEGFFVCFRRRLWGPGVELCGPG